MQSLDEQFGDRTVTGGNLNGTEFKKLTVEQLKRAARRYPTDDILRKYAKAKMTIVELEGKDDPLPCAPLRANQVVPAKDTIGKSRGKEILLAAKTIFWELLVHPIWKYVCLLAFLIVLARPAIMHVSTKCLARLLRLALREVFHFLTLLVRKFGWWNHLPDWLHSASSTTTKRRIQRCGKISRTFSIPYTFSRLGRWNGIAS